MSAGNDHDVQIAARGIGLSRAEARQQLNQMRAVSEAGDALVQAVHDALAALEERGVSAKDADEFVRECVFEAWWGWDYGKSRDA